MELTKGQRQILKQLKAAYESGEPFIDLQITRVMRLRMAQRDLLIESRGIDGSVKYKITFRGLEALRCKSARRSDGRCPACNGARPRQQTPAGRLLPYCETCKKAKEKQGYRARRRRIFAARMAKIARD